MCLVTIFLFPPKEVENLNLGGVEKGFGGGRKFILGGVESEFGGGRFQKFSARFARPRSTPPKINPVSGPGGGCHPP